ncbi:MAG TPA: amidohydrolase [Syntrophales bacterium]|nr:amidohydrolase [Syntrophales bacterium]HOX95021.1 amidohydrolase [Syntrophales bacterium]HPI56870.1 amidohydrolase [Syntrophales bacterium]HPN23456.1 amidohydrolase [Syntrophales bacterium]HQM28019.1 amidohydrolase [Syntrophales bacterium]
MNRETELDILIRGGTLLTMSEAMEIVHDPVIGIRDGKILFVDRSGPSTSPLPAGETLDASHSIILPGLVNTHTHLPMTLFRGLADDLPLMEWLNHHIFPAEAKYVNREMVYAGSLLAMTEMILSGTTTFCDGYFYESRVAQAAVDAGVRAVTAQGFIDSPASGTGTLPDNIEIAERFIDKWRGKSELLTPALFCHSPYTCSPETLKAIKKVSREARVPYIVHLAETRDEARIIRERYGVSPVMHLEKSGVLDDATVAVHCVWLEDEDLEVLAARGVKVSHNPESNMKLASGVAPVPDMLKKGIRVGLGTDGCASNNNLDMFQEMDTAAKLHKVFRRDPTVMDARTVLQMATIGGARVLNLADRIGSVEAGKDADIILVDTRKPHLTPLYNCYSQLVYAAGGADVSTVIINGKIVLKDRRFPGLDVEGILDRARKVARKIGEKGG